MDLIQLEDVVAVLGRTLAEDDPSRLGSEHDLAVAYRTNGQIQEAVLLLEHVVTVRERTLAEDDPLLLGSQLDLSVTYQSDGQIKEAVQLLQHIVEVKEKALAVDDPSLLQSKHMLAVAYQTDGQTKKAVELLEYVISVGGRKRGEDHPALLVSKQDLVVAYQDNGQIKEAVQLLEHLVAVRERTLAEDPFLLESQHDLAVAYRTNGQIKEAMQLLQHVVMVQERTLAENDPSQLGSQRELAATYRADGQIKKAIQLLEHVVAVRERTLAEDDPLLLGSQLDLSVAYQTDGQNQEAVQLLQHIVEVKEKALTEDDPSLLQSKHTLAIAYQNDRQTKKAVELLDHVVAVREKTLAEDDPALLRLQHDLAVTYHSDGQTKKAIELLEHVVAVGRTLPDDHPVRLASHRILAPLLMAFLHQDRGHEIQITEDVIRMAAENKEHGERLMTLLIFYRGAEIKITEGILKAAAENKECGDRIMALLLDKRGDEITITEEVLKAAAFNEFRGECLMGLLLNERRTKIRITEEVIKAAAGNERSGQSVMTLVLDRLEETKDAETNIIHTWTRDLQTIGYSLEEVASLLLQEARDSPWIYFEPNDFPRTQPQPGLHIFQCSHHCCSYRQSGHARNMKTWPPEHHSRTRGHEDIIEMIEELCGLAGVSPRSRNMTDWVGSAEFTEENQMVAVSYTLPTDQSHVFDLKSFKSRISRALEYFRSAAGIVQSHGLCCDSFTVLTSKNQNHKEAATLTAEVTPVDFQLVLNLAEALKSPPELPTVDKLLAASRAILNIVCPTLPELRGGSDIQYCLHLCALTVQFLCLGFLSYTQAHIGPLQPFFLEKPLIQVKLLGLRREEGFPCLIAKLVELTCLGKMTRRPVLIFQAGKHIAQHQTSERPQDRQNIQKYDVFGRAEYIMDTWGPGNLIFPRKPSRLPIAIKLGDGFLFGIEHEKCHWVRGMKDMMNASAMDLQRPLLIGVLVEVNNMCQLDEAQCRRISSSAFEHLGTFRSSWKKAHRTGGMTGGQYVSAQYSVGWDKKDGIPIKDTALANLDEDLIQYMDDYWGVQ
ncbi:uncharacterized protein N7458_002539 [Penicillium daleae]|uniref:MalT-like TPR region domain-containing protein n=1 Tax=Penicillium daleae TaxID=63821 RepID=A0AAD6G797_9EURO|nr:uncharacterized protein N7458_002539 [Penicillium daleae]KAJ5460987.1 hypothetical protein N7458_002539 [Penicillium daleae]